MPLDHPFALKIFDNGRDSMTIEFAKSLVSIVYKTVNDIEIRNNIFTEFIQKYPLMKTELNNFIIILDDK
jgi:hypothetical protein